jgi:hypothetical protein
VSDDIMMGVDGAGEPFEIVGSCSAAQREAQLAARDAYAQSIQDTAEEALANERIIEAAAAAAVAKVSDKRKAEVAKAFANEDAEPTGFSCSCGKCPRDGEPAKREIEVRMHCRRAGCDENAIIAPK